VIIELAWGAAGIRIENTLRHLVGFGGSGAAGSVGAGVEREVRERARRALRRWTVVVAAEDV